MFESFGFENLTPLSASLILGLVVGALFGIFAQVSRFCLRRAVAGPDNERRPALAVWLLALASAVVGTQFAVFMGLIDFSEHRFHNNEIPLIAVLIGGALFGVGMVLTRGCISRITVLSGSGNLRALMVLIIFSMVSHAMLKGILAPVRVWLGQFTINLDGLSLLGQLPGGIWAAVIFIVVATGLVVWRSGASVGSLLLGVLIGALVPLTWIGTGWLLLDDFDPIAFESLSFTLPVSQSLFWVVASTAITPGFGVGLVLGVLGGSVATHLVRGQIHWQSFETPKQTGRYFTGASFMGVGGVLAGGCTVGAGLAGVSSLSVAAVLALVAIVLGAQVARVGLSFSDRRA